MIKKCIAIILALSIIFICAQALAKESTAPSGSFIYADGWFYRRDYVDGEHCLVRSCADGTQAKRISSNHGLYDFFCVVGDTVFYLGNEKELGDFDDRCKIWAVNVDGTNERALTKLNRFTNLFASNTHVYAEEKDRRLVRYRIDPWKKVNRINPHSLNAYHLQIDGNWIYCADIKQNAIRRVRTEGGKINTLISFAKHEEIQGMAILDGHIYYCLFDETKADASIWRASLKGGERQKITSGSWYIGNIDGGWAYGRHISPGGPAFDMPYSIGFGGRLRVNVQTGEVQELDIADGYSTLTAGDRIICYSFDDESPMLLYDPKNNTKTPLRED